MGNKGLALIMVVGILAVIIAVGVTFAVNMRLEAQSAANFRDSVRAKYLAEAGIELAVAALRNDVEPSEKIQVLHGQVVPGNPDTPVDVSGLVDPASAPDEVWRWNRWCEGFDWLFDEWAEWFIPYLWREQSEAHIFMFGPAWDDSGNLMGDAELVDVDGDGIYDATWHYVEVPIKGYTPQDLPKGVLYGRYAVKVIDESRMININAVGKLDSGGNYNNAYNLAETPAEIDIVPLLKEVLPPPYNSDANARQIAEVIVRWRYGEWRGDTGVGPGNDGSVDGSGYEADGRDNDFDGVVDNPGEANLEDPTEFNPESPTGNDMPFRNLEDLRDALLESNVVNQDDIDDVMTALRNYITVCSQDYEKYLDIGAMLWKDKKSNINVSDVKTLVREVLQEAKADGEIGWSDTEIDRLATQLAVNIADFADGDYNVEGAQTGDGITVFGGDRLVFVNEVRANLPVDPNTGAEDVGEFIEIACVNPFEWPITAVIVEVRAGSRDIRIPSNVGSIVVPPKSIRFFTIGDQGGGRKEPNGCDYYFPLSLSNSGRVEIRKAQVIGAGADARQQRDIMYYSDDTSDTNSCQKDDPRCGYVLFGSDYQIHDNAPQTPGYQNAVFNPRGEVDSSNWITSFVPKLGFASIGELGYIHTGVDWTTVPLRSDLSGNEVYDNFDVFLKIFDRLWERYYVKPKNAPDVWAKIGKININTAPPEVLECLPYIGNQSCYHLIDYYRMLYKEQSSGVDAYKFVFRYPSDIFYALHSNELNVPNPMDYIRSLCSSTYPVGVDADGDGYRDEDDEYERWALVANLITTNSYQFRILAVGQALRWVDTDGDGVVDKDEISVTAERRAEAVVERKVQGGNVDIEVLSCRELGQ